MALYCFCSLIWYLLVGLFYCRLGVETDTLGRIFILSSVVFGNRDTHRHELTCVLAGSKDARLSDSRLCRRLLLTPRIALRETVSPVLSSEIIEVG